MEDPDREPSVIPLDQEDRRVEENTTTNQELCRGRPVLNSAATDLLKTIQQLRASLDILSSAQCVQCLTHSQWCQNSSHREDTVFVPA